MVVMGLNCFIEMEFIYDNSYEIFLLYCYDCKLLIYILTDTIVDMPLPSRDHPVGKVR